jgi:hypothetical protein
MKCGSEAAKAGLATPAKSVARSATRSMDESFRKLIVPDDMGRPSPQVLIGFNSTFP